jgi:phosphatidylinositol-3-phosphatase
VATAAMVTAALALAVAACTSAGTGQPAGSPTSNAAAPTSAATGPGASPSAAAPGATAPGAAPAGALPRPAHTLVVVLENHGYGQVIGSPDAPFINSLAGRGALFTNATAVTHPSEPNYLAMFSGSTQGVTDDSCPHEFSAPNLATGLLAAHDTFAGYSENLPGTGSPVCAAGVYARKHVPWTNFSNVPSSVSLPFGAFPAGDYARLPTVSFVIPNLCDDMHDCSVAVGDSWLKAHIGPYATWAMTHDSLLVVAWDENDGSPGNQIPLIFAGQMVRPGRYGQPVTHYGVLSTIETAYGVPRTGHAASTGPITGIWR